MDGIVRIRARDLKGSNDGGAAVHGSKGGSSVVLGGRGDVCGASDGNG